MQISTTSRESLRNANIPGVGACLEEKCDVARSNIGCCDTDNEASKADTDGTNNVPELL